MMKIFLGCDGGSTKTELIVVNETGNLLAHRMSTGCNYSYLGPERFEHLFRELLIALFTDAGITRNDITYAVFGLPAYGETEETEKFIPVILSRLLPQARYRIVNDAVIGWSGSLSAHPGINIVSGTGSISYGVDPTGCEMRVGGWSLIFCDEGSCSWIGRQAIRVFTMQCDGQLPRTQLYYLIKKHYSLFSKDIYFSQILMELPNNSASLAELQLIVLEAYHNGDVTMFEIYEEAAKLLVDTAITIRAHLTFPTDNAVQVSYSGGLFKAGDVILKPFLDRLEVNGFMPIKPIYSPLIGSVALASSAFLEKDKIDSMLETANQIYSKSTYL